MRFKSFLALLCKTASFLCFPTRKTKIYQIQIDQRLFNKGLISKYYAKIILYICFHLTIKVDNIGVHTGLFDVATSLLIKATQKRKVDEIKSYVFTLIYVSI